VIVLQGTYNHNAIVIYIQNVFKIIIVIQLSSLQIHRLGGVCIHVSALLQLAVKHYSDSQCESNDETSDYENSVPATSRPCTWNKPTKGPVSCQFLYLYFIVM